MEFYQIAGKVMVSAKESYCFLFLEKKEQLRLILQQEACPYDKLVKMKCSGLAFLEI